MPPEELSTYEVEPDEKLRREFEGDVDEDVHIEIPRLPEVNPDIYKDVEPILFRGFLHVAAEINGVSFVFKSLNHHEYEMLNLMQTIEASRKSVRKYYDLFLAYGVFMVDGSNILSDREKWIPDLTETFSALDDGARRMVIRYLSEINRRANRAVILTEAFSMELPSRLRWAQLKDVDVTGTSATGIVGTSTLGMNWAQLTWRALNYYEDMKDQAEREWENAKFIASAMAGKGMSKVHNQDRHRRRKEAESRIDRRDKVIRYGVLGEPIDQAGSKVLPVQVPRTVEELAKQLEMDLRGEKDWHDQIVAAHEAHERSERETQVQRIRELRETHKREMGGFAVTSKSEIGVSSEEVKFRIERRRQLIAQHLAAQQANPELFDPKTVEFVDKWDQANQPEVAGIPVSNRAPGTPFRFPKG